MAQWRGRHDYRANKAKVRTLMANHFIPYIQATPSVFVEAVDNNHEVFVTNNVAPSNK